MISLNGQWMFVHKRFHADVALADNFSIEPADQSRIFERFERAVSASRTGGFGLGLWITQQIVEARGGTVAVQSAAGAGSTFIVELPLA